MLTPAMGEVIDTVIVVHEPPDQSDRGDQSTQV
jgi:hypothetical protein